MTWGFLKAHGFLLKHPFLMTALQTTLGTGGHSAGWLSGSPGEQWGSPSSESAMLRAAAQLGRDGTDRGDRCHLPFLAGDLQLRTKGSWGPQSALLVLEGTFTHIITNPPKAGVTFSPLQGANLKFRKVKQPAQGHESLTSSGVKSWTRSVFTPKPQTDGG